MMPKFSRAKCQIDNDMCLRHALKRVVITLPGVGERVVLPRAGIWLSTFGY